MSRHDKVEFADETVQRFGYRCFSGGIQRTVASSEEEGKAVGKARAPGQGAGGCPPDTGGTPFPRRV